MDYDQSIKHPAHVCLKHFRRPAREAWAGAEQYRPDDVCLGEPDYNPFAFDVAMLGNLFRVQFCVRLAIAARLFVHTLTWYFKDAVSSLPGLAALYDRMTTHIVSQRFTAEEAQAFLQSVMNRSPRDVLTVRLKLAPRYDAMSYSDVYWSKLSPQLQKSWSELRTPPTPFWSNILDWLIRFPTVCNLIVPVRRILGV